MLDTAQNTGSSYTQDNESTGEVDQKKRQYTVKGVDDDTVVLMREAARKEGMKIGAWISTRMKEAATRSLRQERDLPNSNCDGVTTSPQLEAAVNMLSEQYAQYDARLDLIQKELHEITRSQRTIMEKMLSTS